MEPKEKFYLGILVDNLSAVVDKMEKKEIDQQLGYSLSYCAVAALLMMQYYGFDAGKQMNELMSDFSEVLNRTKKEEGNTHD